MTVTDEDAYRRHAHGATEAIAAHKGVFLAQGGRRVTMEGPGRPRNVVVRFPSVELARCATLRRTTSALAHAAGTAERELVIVEITDSE